MKEAIDVAQNRPVWRLIWYLRFALRNVVLLQTFSSVKQ